MLPISIVSLIGIPPALVGKLTAFENFVAELLEQSTHPLIAGQSARPVANPEHPVRRYCSSSFWACCPGWPLAAEVHPKWPGAENLARRLNVTSLVLTE